MQIGADFFTFLNSADQSMVVNKYERVCLARDGGASAPIKRILATAEYARTYFAVAVHENETVFITGGEIDGR